MSELQGATQAPVNYHRHLCTDNLLYNISDAELISVLGIGDDLTSMKLVDPAATYTNLVPVEPTTFNKQQCTGVDSYVTFDFVSSQNTGQGINIYLDQAAMQVQENLYGQAPTYVNHKPEQTQVTVSLSDETPTYTNLGPVQTQELEYPSPDISNITPHELNVLNSDSSVSSPVFYVHSVNQDATPNSEDDGKVESPGAESLSYASSPSNFGMSEGSPPSSPLVSSTTDGNQRPRRQTKSRASVQSLMEPDSDSCGGGPIRNSRGQTRRSRGPGRSSSGSERSTNKKRRPRERKTKLYEKEDPFDDPKEEKKRQDAINSKKNRDRKKQIMDDLKEKVAEAVQERDRLKREVEELHQREKNLRDMLWDRTNKTP